jgi:hypothetical protein
MLQIRGYDGVLGFVATHAAEDSDGCTSLRAYCTNAGVVWAARAGCGRNVAIVTEPYTQSVMGDWGRRITLRRNVVPTARD